MTEGDRIRHMKDEELAQFLSNGMVCMMCPARRSSCYKQNRGCKEAWLHHLGSVSFWETNQGHRKNLNNVFLIVFLGLIVLAGLSALAIMIT